MSVNLTEGHRLTIDIKGCSLKNVDPTCWFDAANVKTKDFSLKLDSPYERAVCIELLRLAGGSDEYKIDKFLVLEGESDNNGREITFDSYSPHSATFDAILSEKDNSHHTNTSSNSNNHIVSTHIRQIYAKMFERYDTNNSGGLDWKEMLVVLDELGMESSLEIIQKLLLVYDSDGSGIIELDEVRKFIHATLYWISLVVTTITVTIPPRSPSLLLVPFSTIKLSQKSNGYVLYLLSFLLHYYSNFDFTLPLSLLLVLVLLPVHVFSTKPIIIFHLSAVCDLSNGYEEAKGQERRDSRVVREILVRSNHQQYQ